MILGQEREGFWASENSDDVKPVPKLSNMRVPPSKKHPTHAAGAGHGDRRDLRRGVARIDVVRRFYFLLHVFVWI